MQRGYVRACALAACVLLVGCATTHGEWVDATGQLRPTWQLNSIESNCGQQAFQAQQGAEQQQQNDGCNTKMCMAGKFALYEEVFNTTYQQCMISNGLAFKDMPSPPTGQGSSAAPSVQGSDQVAGATQSGSQAEQLEAPPAGSSARPSGVAQSVPQPAQVGKVNASNANDLAQIGNSNVMKAFVIRSTIQPSGSWTDVKVMINYYADYRPPHGYLMHHYRSAELFLKVNCAARLYTFDHETDYIESNLQGAEVNDRHIFFQSNKTPQPGTVAGNAYAFVCG